MITTHPRKRPVAFSRIIIVVLMAALGYGITVFAIGHSTIQYASQPTSFSTRVNDGADLSGTTDVIFNFKLHSQLPVDSLETRQIIHRKARAYFPGTTYGALLYHQNPTFLVWLMLIATMVAIAAGTVPVFIALIGELKRKFTLTRRQLRLGWLYAFLLAGILMTTSNTLPGFYKPEALITRFHILLTSGTILIYIVAATIILMLPVFALVFLIGVSSDNIVLETNDEKNIENAVRKLRSLHDALQQALQVLSIVVVFSVLTSSTLGLSIKATIRAEHYDLYPPELSYMYGLYFTVFLCIIYVPVYYYIKYHYNQLKELAVELDFDDDHSENNVYQSLFGDVRFEGTVVNNLKLSLTLLAPILSSFLPAGLNVFH